MLNLFSFQFIFLTAGLLNQHTLCSILIYAKDIRIEIYFQILNQLEGTYTLRILTDFFDLFFKIGPYLIIAVALNVISVRYFRAKTVNFTAKNEPVSIVVASLIGLASPLPTYAAIPIGLSLMSNGIPFSAVIAFVISSPLMNPTIFFLTATQISMEMAMARLVTAFLLGITGGLIAMKVFKSFIPDKKSAEQNLDTRKNTILKDICKNSLYIGKYFSISILLSAAVKALIPPETIVTLLGSNSKTGTLIAIAMGVPFYSCGGAAIPFIETLMELGMGKGAMLAFFIAGPATKLETLYAFKTQLGSRILIFYLVLTLVFSYISGMIYQFL